MKAIIAVFSTLALMAGVGTNEAKAENFFHKLGREIKNAHERHEDMMEEAHERHEDMARHGIRIQIGERGYGRGDGHYESFEVQEWVEAYETVQYDEVQTPGHYEFQQVVEVVTPAMCQKVYVQPVFHIERDRCGVEIRIMLRSGYWTVREIPAVTCIKTVRVWVDGECQRVARTVCIPGHYEAKCVQVWVCD